MSTTPPGAHTALGAGREFDLVRALVERWGARATGLGDDAAVLDVPAGRRLVVSTDASVENVHFRAEWLTPAEIGWRATVAALSDLAAMASEPLGIVVALALPARWRPHALEIGDGIADAVEHAGTRIVGGDTTGGQELSLAVTVLGHASAPLCRTGGRRGDAVWVTGELGGPLLALRALDARRVPDATHRARFARPSPRLAEARWLADRGATSMVDVSDGLAGDLGHLAAASGVRLQIELDQLPRIEGATVEDAARGGEEYEVALTGPADLDAAAFEREFGLRLTRIGEVVEGGAGVVALRGGEFVDLAPGYDHLSI